MFYYILFMRRSQYIYIYIYVCVCVCVCVCVWINESIKNLFIESKPMTTIDLVQLIDPNSYPGTKLLLIFICHLIMTEGS